MTKTKYLAMLLFVGCDSEKLEETTKQYFENSLVIVSPEAGVTCYILENPTGSDAISCVPKP